MTPSLLTLSDLKGQSQRHSDFKALYPVKEPSLTLCYYWLLIGNPICRVQWYCQISHSLTLKSESQGQKFGLFCFTTTGYRAIRSAENQKWTDWPHTELEHLTVKSTLHMPSTYPRGPNFGPFCYTISPFRDTSTTSTMSAKMGNAPNDPKLNLNTSPSKVLYIH